MDDVDDKFKDREICCKRDCGKYAVIVTKVYTEERPVFIPLCCIHMMGIGEIIDLMVQNMVMGDV